MYHDLHITVPEKPEFSAKGAVASVQSNGELRLKTSVRLPSGAKVSITGGKYSTSGRVVESETVEGEHRALVRTSSIHDRRHVRVAVNEETWMNLFHDSDRTAYPVRVIDVSDSGIGLVAKNEFLPGSLVELKFMEGMILAVVRNSVRMGVVAHRIGVEIQMVMYSADSAQPIEAEPIHWWTSVLKKLGAKS